MSDTLLTERKNAALYEKQKKVLIQILKNELTVCQRQTFVDYHFKRKSVCKIAAERGVNKSTVFRTLVRAEQKVKRYLKYFQYLD